jgi:predicted esterase
MNFIGNYYKPGPNSGGRFAFFQRVLASRGYFHGNIMADAYPDDPWSLVMWDPKWTPEQIAAFKLKAPTPVSAVPPDESAATAFHRVLGEVGATRPKRDPIDTRLINDVSKGIGRIIDDEAEVGGWPELKSAPAPADQDKDGMPDAWETTRGLNANDAGDGAKDRDGDGYTNLEEYLNDLAAGRSGSVSSAETEPGKLPSTMLDRVGTEPGAAGAKYVLHVPAGYESEKTYPLVVFLHGSQVYGTDGRRQLATGLPSYMRKDPEYLKQHDAALRQTFIVFPQSRARSFFLGDDAELVMAVVRDVQRHYRVDPRRIYLTGLSMGGYGVWNLAIRYPEVWAAIAPVCGGGEPAKATAIKDIPCWVWHGDKDDRVPVQLARDMVAALKAAGGNPKYTELPGVGHSAYGPAYKSAEFWTWLLAQRKS